MRSRKPALVAERASRPREDRPRPRALVRDGGRLRTAYLAALLSSAVALSQPQDVAGWGQTKWGMSIAETRAMFPSAEEKKGSLLVKNVDLAKVSCHGSLVFDKQGKLERVLLIPDKETRQNAKKILEALRAKYGRPTSADSSEVSWSFTSTRIRTLIVVPPDGDKVVFWLSYQSQRTADPNL